MRPEGLGADGVVRVAGLEEVLEEAHVLEGEDGDLVVWLGVLVLEIGSSREEGGRGANLVDYLRWGGIFAVEACFGAVVAGWSCFLALVVTLKDAPFTWYGILNSAHLDSSSLAVEATPPALGVALSFHPMLGQRCRLGEW